MAPIVAVVTKDTKDQTCGISFLRNTNPSDSKPVIIGGIAEDGLFASSPLLVGMEVKSVNNTAVSTSTEAINIIKETIGQLTIIADVAPVEAVPVKVVSSVATTTTATIPSSSAIPAGGFLDFRKTESVVAVVTKEKKDQNCGISMRNGSNGKVIISVIDKDGLFASYNPALIGMEVESVNYASVSTSTEAITIIKEAVGELRIKAVPPPVKKAAPASDAPKGILGEGGQWGKNKYVGANTQAAACIGCLCCCLPGLCILLCPFDERDAYKHTDGKVYDASGKVLGHSNNVSFIPKRNAMSR